MLQILTIKFWLVAGGHGLSQGAGGKPLRARCEDAAAVCGNL